MYKTQRVLLKITGTALLNAEGTLSSEHVMRIAEQIKQLSDQIQFGIVIGGGNFFRGSQHSSQLGLDMRVGHSVGMLATVMNGLIIQDVFKQAGLRSTLLSAVSSPVIGWPISQETIDRALAKGAIPIFSGGVGAPYFSTDTAAIVRALQIGAQEVWKATNVDGIYAQDPVYNPQAPLIKKLSYAQALTDNIRIVDRTALILAQEQNIRIRVFNAFASDILIHAARDTHVGSTLL